MYIARLRIKGFRNVATADIALSRNSVLIGPNNVGKTTVIEALALILGREGMVRSLTEHDFFGSSPQISDRVKIVATISDFGSSKPEMLPEWFSIRRGVPKWYNPATGEESANEKPAPFQLSCNIAFQARFDHDHLEVETKRYFHDDDNEDDVFVEDVVTPVPIGLVRDIGLFLIPASRSWDRMISFGSELFRRVVSSSDGLPADAVIAERDNLRGPKEPLEENPKLKPVIAEVNREITALFGPGNDLRLRVTSTDSNSVLESVVPHFTTSAGSLVPSRRQGSGLISLQSLFLLLHFGTKRVSQGNGFCLAIEEPELHLPPAVQRRVLRRLKALSSQTIVSTHSPLIAGFADPTDLLIVSNSKGALSVRPLLRDALGSTTPNAIRKLFEIHRVEVASAVMSESVLVPEGRIDYEWLSLLMRVVELQPDLNPLGVSFSSSVGLIPTQSGAVETTAQTLASCHARVGVLVDGDSAGRTYAKAATKNGAAYVARWPDEWTIEDVVGWIIDPGKTAILEDLNKALGRPCAALSELVARLKNDDKKDPGHLKGDFVACEVIAQGIATNAECRARAAGLLEAIACVARGIPTSRFVNASPITPSVLVFQP